MSWFSRLFRRSKPTPKPQETTPTGTPSVQNPDSGIFAFVVGHNKRAQGANNYLGESEWVFNTRVAKMAQQNLKERGFDVFILFRPEYGGYAHECRTVANEAESLGVKYAFCLHFNSAGQGAKGCEVLILNTSDNTDNKLADFLSDELNEKLGIFERKQDGVFVIDSSHNGSGMLNALKSKGITAVLPEPCFANYKTPESEAIFADGGAKYAEILADCVYKLLTKTLPEVD